MPNTPDELRGVLQSRGITEEGAAVLAGVSVSAVSRILNGRQRPRRETVVRLARALGISALRMQAMTDATWTAAREGRDEAERLPVG